MREKNLMRVPALLLQCGGVRFGRGVAIVAALVLLLAWQVSGLAMDQAKPGDNQMDPHAGVAMPSGMSGGSMAPADVEALQKAALAAYAKQDRTELEKGVDLEQFRRLAIENNDQLKIIDSWARQSISRIRNRQTIDGKDPVYVALDMALRPAAWEGRNIIYVQAVPVREVLTQFAKGETEEDRRKEGQRIMHEGLVSPLFIEQDAVVSALEKLSLDSSRTNAVNKVWQSYGEVSFA